MFITFEGLDFCGKSTQVRLLDEYLSGKNKKVKIIREPGGTNISENIRKILLDKDNSEMFIETELLLFSASRAQLVREIIMPLLEKNYYVISDRFHDSSIAYQGYGRGIHIGSVREIQNFAIGSSVPRLSFIIDIPIDVMLERRAKFSSESLDRIERSENEFYNKVRNGYSKMSEESDRFKMIDGTLSIEDIHNKVINEISLIESL
jgi:dTMP kinase